MNQIKVNVCPYGGLNPIYMEFLNGGKITIPAQYGGYVIASGCGAGKTTIIKELLANPAVRLEGVLYSAFTINECNEMYAHVKSVYEKEGRADKLKDEVIVLHSDIKSDGVDNNTWRNNPQKILEMPVVICTHAKLFSELPELLIGYKGYPKSYHNLSPVERATLGCYDKDKLVYLPRQLVLIDELPINDSLTISIPKSTVRALGNKRQREVGKNPDGSPILEPYFPFIYDRPRTFNQMLDAYKCLTKDQKFIDETKNALNRTKAELILGGIYDNYQTFVEFESDNDIVPVNYNASSLLLCNPNTRILLFDGTGDLTFVNSRRFKLLKYQNKYNSQLSIDTFPFKLKRYQDSSNIDINEINNELINNIDYIESILKSGRTPLIVTWKNLKGDKYKDKKSTSGLSKTILNDEFSLPEFYKEALRKRGFVNGFDIIHYQSGLDKATNQFRDYDTVIFLGEFHVPNYVVSKFNFDYGTGASAGNYLTYQLVQTICRTRIRKHAGESIEVYFSEDWRRDSIDELIDYIINGIVRVRDHTLDHIKPKWKGAVRTLMNLDKGFEDAVLSFKPYNFTIRLDDIYKLIPASEKKVRVYYPLINYLRKININLTITSQKTY